MDVNPAGISCCFDQESQRMLKDYRKTGLSKTAIAIANAITKDGIAGSTILEIGCGFGALTLDLVRRGAYFGTGLDLSPEMIRLAGSLASEGGLSERVSFELGDGAVAKLKKSDIVILDTVLCCYPDASSLVDNSASAAGRFYAISIPDDTRLATRIIRLFLPLQSIALRRKGFRFFIHPTKKVKEKLEEKGFRLLSKSSAGWIWSVFIFGYPGVHL